MFSLPPSLSPGVTSMCCLFVQIPAFLRVDVRHAMVAILKHPQVATIMHSGVLGCQPLDALVIAPEQQNGEIILTTGDVTVGLARTMQFEDARSPQHFRDHVSGAGLVPQTRARIRNRTPVICRYTHLCREMRPSTRSHASFRLTYLRVNQNTPL